MLSFTDIILVAVLWVNLMIFFLLAYPQLSKIRRKTSVKVSYANLQEPPQIKFVGKRFSLRKQPHDDFYDRLMADVGGEKKE